MPSVLVTDVQDDIGRQLALQYADSGWTVFAAHPGAAPDPSFAAVPNGISVSYNPLADDGAKRLASQLSGAALDVLIVVGGPMADSPLADDAATAVWQSVMLANALAPLEVISRLKPQIAAGRQKTIVAISDRSASMALPGRSQDYIGRASRAALHQLLRTIAAEWDDLDCRWLPVCPARHLGADASAAAIRQLIASAAPGQPMTLLSHEGEVLPW